MQQSALAAVRVRVSVRRRLIAATAIATCAVISACGGGGSSGGSGGGGSSSSSLSYSSSSSSSSASGPLATHGLTGAINPIHDPTLIYQGTKWYVFSTDDPPPYTTGYIPIRCSNDRIAFTDCGNVLPALPAWVATAVPAATNVWAPDISYFNGLYHLYYSVSTFGQNRSAIGLATSPTLDQTSPSYGWTDRGAVLTSQSSDNFNAIDANILIDQAGKIWFTYGSFWDGIFQREVDPATGLLKPGAPRHIARRASGVLANPIEGPSIVYKSGYYYLYVSWDTCCGSNPNYKIVVGRSASPNGPFVDKNGVDMVMGGGSILLEGDSVWAGPGGQHAVVDAGGIDVITFHAKKKSENNHPYLWVKTVDYSSGWPVIQP